MATYAECAARHGATAVYWVEISGLQWVFTDGVVYTNIFPTQACDGYTRSRTLQPILRMPSVVYARSIEPLRGSGQQGTFSLELVDYRDDATPDGFCTWLFGGDRSTIASTRLTANVAHHAGGAGHSWGVSDASVFSAQEELYCGLETISPSGIDAVDPDNLTGVTRSLWQSPNLAHSRDQADVYPLVTNHPTRWLGRVVTFYQSYLDGDGFLANTDGTDNTARAAAFKMRGVIKSISQKGGVWTLAMDSIDTLLKRKALRGVPVARYGSRVHLAGSSRPVAGEVAWDLTTTDVLHVVLVDETGASDETHYPIKIANGDYTREAFIAAVNAALSAGVGPTDTNGAASWLGSLTADLGHDSLTWIYHTAAGADVRRCILQTDFDVHMGGAGGAIVVASEYVWAQVGARSFSGSFPLGEDGLAVADTDYTGIFAVEANARSLQIGPPIAATTFVLDVGDGNASATEFTAGQAVVIQSDTAKAQAATVSEIDGANNALTVRNAEQYVRHEGKEIVIRTAYRANTNDIGANLPGQSVLRLLLSTGLAGFNHATYDTERAGIGIEIPHLTPNAGANSNDSLIDVASFERFFGEMSWAYDGMDDLLWEGTTVHDWLVQKLAFLGGWLVVRNGQIAVVRGLVPLQSSSEATIDEDSLIEHSNTSGDDRLVVDGVSYECNWEFIQNEAKLTVTTQLGDGSADFGDNTVEFKDKGIQTNVEKLARLAIDVLGDYSREPWHYTVTCDRVLWRVEPGAVVSFADEGAGDTTNDARRFMGAPTPEGTRGFDGTKMLVLSSEMNLADGTTTLELAHIRRKRSGWSAAAWVQSYTNVGNAVLTCDANFFRPSVDGVDVGAFAVGDKVRLLSVNPTQAGAEPGVETGEAGLTIQSINTTASTITLTGTLAVAWPTPASNATQCYVLVHDSYTTASQTTTAKNWAWIGDTSGDIGDGGDACYEW